MIEEPLTDGCITIDDFERLAGERLESSAWDYYRSGADGQVTLRENRAAFERLSIHYKVFVDVSAPNLGVKVLGRDLPHPILIAPTAYHRLACEDGENATARAAERTGALMVVSTLATTILEEVASAARGPKWFQLYVHKDRALTADLVNRAGASGYEAIVVTADTPVLGRRLLDERNGFSLRQGLTMPNLVPPGSTAEKLLEQAGGSSMLSRYVATRHDASLTWKDVEALVQSTKLPVLVKGIVRPDDAARAIDAGARGVIVSNHGARQLDGSPATIEVLPSIADAIGDRGDVLLDGGIRWGTDVLKALALGARAVLLGRPILWGLAVAGEEGVVRVIETLVAELTRAMALAGAPEIAALDRDLVRHRR
jgi:isopentenyl diphosphate isomerase/L-lactate dehydrogenase-like FMN-dependent dehydrogenase